MSLEASAFQDGGVLIVFPIVGTIAGITLGLRFKVFVLGPATLLATAAAVVSGIGSGHEGAMPIAVFGAVVSLQIGYIAGCILHVMVPAHLPARPTICSRGSGSEPARY